MENNVEVVKQFFAALSTRDKKAIAAVSAEDIQWIVPGKDWPMAGIYRGHRGLENALDHAETTIQMSYPKPPEFISQGDRVIVVGSAVGTIKATGKPFEDHWVFDMTLHNGKVALIREYIDTQAMAHASASSSAGGTR